MEVRVEERGRKKKEKWRSFERKKEKGETGNSCAKNYLCLSFSSSSLTIFPSIYSILSSVLSSFTLISLSLFFLSFSRSSSFSLCLSVHPTFLYNLHSMIRI